MNTSKTNYQNTVENHLPEFYASHPEANRTLRMDSGGVCQFCARKAARRVEMHSPLWQAGPIMYGDCCLPLAEEAIQRTQPRVREQTVSVCLPNTNHRNPLKAGQVLAAMTGIGAAVVWIERLLNQWLSKPF